MTTIVNTYRVVINARPEAVFAYVSDLTRHPEWSGGRLRVEAISSGPIAVGSQYRSYGDLPGQKNRRNELRVTEYQRPTRFAFVAKDPTFGDVLHEFTLKSQEGGTLMERTVTTTMSPGMAFMSRILIHPMIGKPMMNKALAALKTKLEQRAA